MTIFQCAESSDFPCEINMELTPKVVFSGVEVIIICPGVCGKHIGGGQGQRPEDRRCPGTGIPLN